MNRNLNPEQLSMFLPAGHIRENYPSVDATGDLFIGPRGYDYRELSEANDETMDHKQFEGLYNGLADSLAEHGVKQPVRLHRTLEGEEAPGFKGWLGNGGHRVAVSAYDDPKREIPVIHTEEFEDTYDEGSHDYDDYQSYEETKYPNYRPRSPWYDHR